MGRESLSKAILGLPPDASLAQVTEELDVLVAQLDKNDTHTDATSSASPLMVACDRANVSVLRYLQNLYFSSDKSVFREVGSPLEEYGGNTPLHHAAMSGCSEAIEILSSFGTPFHEFGATSNSHGDTGLMFACTYGHLKFCRVWNEQFQNSMGATEETANLAMAKIYNRRNMSKDNCIILACSHGKADVVDFLIGQCGVEVDASDFEKCQASYQRMKKALQNNAELYAEHKGTMLSVKKGLDMIKSELERRAMLAQKELLSGDLVIETPVVSRKAGKRSTKKKSNNRSSKAMSSNSASDDIPSREQGPVEKTESLKLTRLPTGELAVAVGNSGVAADSTPLHVTLPPKPSTEEMFRRTLQSSRSTDVDALMDALCLDVSMLLYTPHGMALNLSSSQLDAVQSILEEQLKAASEARAIQGRMRKC